MLDAPPLRLSIADITMRMPSEGSDAPVLATPCGALAAAAELAPARSIACENCPTSYAAATGEWPMVRQAWMVSGDSDFLLHCVAANLTRFQDFVIEELTANAQVDTVRTMLTIRQVKKVGLVEI